MKWMLVSHAALSKHLDSVILASWKSLPCCSSSLSHYCGAWKSADGTADFPQKSRLTESARSCQNKSRYRSVKYQLSILSLGRALFMSSNVDTLHFVSFPRNAVRGVFPSRSLTNSLKITLLLSGMHFVKFSTYVDAFWLVVMFIMVWHITQVEPILALPVQYSRTPDERPPSPTTIPLIRTHFV